jgi:hypothetical protein
MLPSNAWHLLQEEVCIPELLLSRARTRRRRRKRSWGAGSSMGGLLTTGLPELRPFIEQSESCLLGYLFVVQHLAGRANPVIS